MLVRHALRNYGAFMSCAAESGWLVEVQQQLGGWLREKDLDVDLAADVAYQNGNRSIRLLHHKDAQSSSIRAQLVEQGTPHGTWTTELVACDRRSGDGWLSIKVENDQDRFVAIPRIARYLMQTLPLGDDRVRFVDRPQLLKRDDVERLVELLRDEERHGLVLVAGTADDEIPFESFVQRMRIWNKEVTTTVHFKHVTNSHPIRFLLPSQPAAGSSVSAYSAASTTSPARGAHVDNEEEQSVKPYGATARTGAD